MTASFVSLRRWLRVGALTAAALGSAHCLAQPSPATPAVQTEEQLLLAVDDAYIAAEVAHDEAGMRRLIDDRFVFNADDGSTSGKDAFVQRVLKLPQLGQAVRERTVLIEGDIAFVFATTDIRLPYPGKPAFVYSGRYTCADVKRQGQWRMPAFQMQDRSAK